MHVRASPAASCLQLMTSVLFVLTAHWSGHQLQAGGARPALNPRWLKRALHMHKLVRVCPHTSTWWSRCSRQDVVLQPSRCRLCCLLLLLQLLLLFLMDHMQLCTAWARLLPPQHPHPPPPSLYTHSATPPHTNTHLYSASSSGSVMMVLGPLKSSSSWISFDSRRICSAVICRGAAALLLTFIVLGSLISWSRGAAPPMLAMMAAVSVVCGLKLVHTGGCFPTATAAAAHPSSTELLCLLMLAQAGWCLCAQGCDAAHLFDHV